MHEIRPILLLWITLFSGKIGVFGGMCSLMTYIETKLKREIVIDSIITIHYFEYMRDFVFRGESHDFWEFMYVDKGSVIVQGGEHQFTLHAGDIIFHEPNEFHAIRSVGNSSPNLVAVSFVSHSPAMGEFRGKKMTLNMEERTLVSHILDTARKVLSTPMNIPSVEQVKLRADTPIGSQQMILLYLELFLVTVLQNDAKPDVFPRRRITGTFVSPVELSGTREKRLQEITEFMEFHICEQLSLDQLCEHFSLSRSSIQKLFQKEKGCGPMEYFNGLKIQRAKDMIRDGRKNLTEIAGFLSYSSLPYFSKQFKKATGMAPMEYASSVKGITQALKGEELHYHKTQYTNTNEDTIDSPGEYAESKHFSVGLACFSFEADVIAIVQAANEPFNLFSDGSRNFLLRPLIGIITKVDSPHANIPMVRQWMENMGCERIFMVNNKTREGISELMDYLQDDLPKLTLEQAKFKQSIGLNEWDPMPEGVEYPEKIR